MGFARKFKRSHDETMQDRHKEFRKGKSMEVVHKRKIINLGTMKKKYER